MPFNTLSVASAVTPSVLETGISHYLNRKPLHQKPTAHISYHVGLRLIKQFLDYASHHTIEDLQTFTAQWVPSPRWVHTEHVQVDNQHLLAAAERIQLQLGPEGLKAVGGLTWWQWRPESRPLHAEWIEMRKDYLAHKQNGTPYTRSMLYVHGGAYYFGSVDEHRYQLQRHARKLQARILAPRYRLAPQYPFPCGLLDVLATYLYLLTVQPPETIIVAGDSAGAGMVVSMLVILRDQDIPLPAGAILLSPWVDLTHSFPSVAGQSSLDYVPPHGFMHKPSIAWPPPNADDLKNIHQNQRANVHSAEKAQERSQGFSTEEAKDSTTGAPRPEPSSDLPLSIRLGGKLVEIKDQIQIYTTNALLSHPLVSPVLQPSLGGLPPLCIITGGGEVLRDEQIYLAHKAAAPRKYAPSAAALKSQGPGAAETVNKYRPTYVQLQVWDDMCHVATTLSFTRPAKYMYRSVAQFGAWALAQAQNEDMTIVDDDAISVISNTSTAVDDTSEPADRESRSSVSSTSQFSLFSRSSLRASISSISTLGSLRRKDSTAVDEDVAPDEKGKGPEVSGVFESGPKGKSSTPAIGKAGDPLPAFKDHMIRQRVSRHGEIFHLAPAETLSACRMNPNDVGVIKRGPVAKWMRASREWGRRYDNEKRAVQGQRIRELTEYGGYIAFEEGERPPPSAVVGRRTSAMVRREAWEGKAKVKRSRGLALWSGWGSAHDEGVIEREREFARSPHMAVASSKGAAPAPTDEESYYEEFYDSVQEQGPPLVAQNSNTRPAIAGQAFPFKLAAPIDGDINPSTTTLTNAPGVIRPPVIQAPQTPTRTSFVGSVHTPPTIRSTISTGSRGLFAGSGFTWDDESLGRPTPERVQQTYEDGDVSAVSAVGNGEYSPSPLSMAKGVGVQRVWSGEVKRV